MGDSDESKEYNGYFRHVFGSTGSLPFKALGEQPASLNGKTAGRGQHVRSFGRQHFQTRQVQSGALSMNSSSFSCPTQKVGGAPFLHAAIPRR